MQSMKGRCGGSSYSNKSQKTVYTAKYNLNRSALAPVVLLINRSSQGGVSTDNRYVRIKREHNFYLRVRLDVIN